MFECFDFVKDIGHICSDVKFSVTFAGDWPFLAVAVGNTFHVYSAEELKLTQIGAAHKSKVTHIAASPGFVFTATESTLRSTSLVENNFEECDCQGITALVSLDSFVVVAVGSVFKGFNAGDLSPMFSFDAKKTITSIYHPLGYRNKFLVCYDDTTFDLWNINSGMVIFSFDGFGSIIRRVVQSPVQDLMAFVLCDGRIVIFDVRANEIHFEIQNSSPVSDISFRLDGPPHLIVGLDDGNLLVYNLKIRQLASMIENAHDCPVASVCCFKGTQFVITGGGDNCIRQWIFDDDTSEYLRLNRFRIGHPTPPVAVTFAEVNGVCQLVTGSGNDKIIATNPAAETTSMLLSLAPLNKRHMVNPIQSLASTNAQRYASVASQHANGTLVFLWDVENSRFARRAMTAMPKNGPRLENDEKISFQDFYGERQATCTFLSRCGNFGFVGTNVGTVEVFVTQSGRRKGSIEKSHEAPLVFVHMDAMNATITSCSEDGVVYFHDFETLGFEEVVNIPAPVSCMAPHPNSQLLAISCNDKVIILDCQSHLIAREFNVQAEHMCFSHDGKYLFVASKSPFVHMFDMITANLIESVQLEKPLTGLAAHPRGTIIATLHEGDVSTRIWNFKPEKIKSMAGASRVAAVEKEGLAVYSGEPEKKIKSIIHPPKDPLKYAKVKRSVPFFLTASTNISALAAAAAKEEEQLAALSRDVMPATAFVAQLIEDSESGDFTASIAILIGLSQQEIALEISALNDTEKGDERLLFLEMIGFALRKKTNFEFVQAVLTVFLSEYGSKILENRALKEKVAEIRDLQKEAIEFMEKDLAHALYLIQLINRTQ